MLGKEVAAPELSQQGIAVRASLSTTLGQTCLYPATVPDTDPFPSLLASHLTQRAAAGSLGSVSLPTESLCSFSPLGAEPALAKPCSPRCWGERGWAQPRHCEVPLGTEQAELLGPGNPNETESVSDVRLQQRL